MGDGEGVVWAAEDDLSAGDLARRLPLNDEVGLGQAGSVAKAAVLTGEAVKYFVIG